jgi:hypothetical protein
MKRKIIIILIAAGLGIEELWKWLKISAKNFPEIVTLPIGIIGLCTYPILLELSGINWLFNYFHDNPAEPNRSLKAFEIMLIAMIYVFLSNAASYAAIKYNNAELWKIYTKEREPKTEYIELCWKELRFYWACYFFGILAAIFLAHSLILI